jgi:hypothetical protein
MTDSALVALIQSTVVNSSPDSGLLPMLERFAGVGWVPLAAFLLFIFRRELQEWMRVRVRMLGKKNSVRVNGGDTVSGDTDAIKKVNGNDPVVLQSHCHEAMGKMESLVRGVEIKIDSGFQDINDKLFDLARDK